MKRMVVYGRMRLRHIIINVYGGVANVDIRGKHQLTIGQKAKVVRIAQEEF